MTNYQFKARPKKTQTAAQDEVGESAQSKKQEAALAKKKGKGKGKGKKVNMRAAAVAMAKKSNKTGNPGAKAAALRRVANKGK